MKTKHNPKVSIVLCAYNNQDFIDQSLKSIINQEYQNWELILINDCSTDNTEKKIKKYLEDKRMIYIKHRENQGIPSSLNDGVFNSSGEYIAILDADDEWIDRRKLQHQVNFLELNRDHSLVGTYAHAVDENEKKLFDIIYPLKDDEIRKVMFRQNCFLHSSILYRKKTLQNLSFYDEGFISQDYDLCLKIGSVSKMANLPIFTVNYTIHPKGTSQTRYKEQTNNTLKIIRRYKNNYPGYFIGVCMWTIRKFYPFWLRTYLFKKTRTNNEAS